MANPLSAAKVILLAAADLAADGSGEFSEWDLTVASWRRDQNRFGCRGYEDEYPDHKRVMMEIMGKKKKDNPIRQGWVERVRPNFYRMTALGLAEAERLGKGSMRAGPHPPLLRQRVPCRRALHLPPDVPPVHHEPGRTPNMARRPGTSWTHQE